VKLFVIIAVYVVCWSCHVSESLVVIWSWSNHSGMASQLLEDSAVIRIAVQM